MNRLFFSFAVLALASGSAQAGYKCNLNTGNCFNTNTDRYGGIDVYGKNLNTGTTWQTHFSASRDLNALNSSGYFWRYDSAKGGYVNDQSTGCFGTGSAQSCN